MPLIKKKISLKKKILSIFKASTCPAIVNLTRTNLNVIFRLFWLFMLLISVTICVWIIFLKIKIFLTYPVTTQITYKVENNAPFPAVKICNRQPFVTEYSIKYLASYLKESLNDDIPKNLTTLQFINKHISDVDLKLLSLANTFKLNNTEKQKIGLTKKELVIKCKFNFKECIDSDFTWVYDLSFGNCFTFNINRSHVISTNAAGLENGLTLELFAGYEGRIPSMMPSYGFEIFLYNQSEDHNFSVSFESQQVSTNTQLNIGIDRSFINKLPKPYSECDIETTKNLGSEWLENSEFLAYSIQSKTIYKQKNCFEFCFKKILLETCGCSVRHMENYRLCSTENELKCFKRQYKNQSDIINNNCRKVCPLECLYSYYHLSTSSQKFPTTAYADHLRNIIKNGKNMTVEEVKDSVAKIVIYYKKLDYKVINEEPVFSACVLIGNIGGLVGLFLGMSWFSLIEIFEIVLNIILVFSKKF